MENGSLAAEETKRSPTLETRHFESTNGDVGHQILKNDKRIDMSDDTESEERAREKYKKTAVQDFGTSDQERDTYPVLKKVNDFREVCGNLVNNSWIQFVIVIMISINAIMMGVGTYDFIRENERLDNIFETVDFVFLVIFTIELSLQFVYHGWRLMLDGWLVFDLVVIATSWYFSSLQIIRAFRIFRALRLVTRIKVMKDLIVAIFGVVPRMAAICVMLIIIFYIFAVMFTSLFGDLHLDGQENQTELNYFGSIGWSLFTLFQFMTLDEWGEICRQVMETYPWSWILFISFIIVSAFVMVNLMIAVICEGIRALHRDEKAKLHGKFGSQSSNSSPPVEIREQLDSLEEQMEELTKVQARTFHTLQYLTRQIQMQKLKEELSQKSEIVDEVQDIRGDRERSGGSQSPAVKNMGDNIRSSQSKQNNERKSSRNINQQFGDSSRASMESE